MADDRPCILLDADGAGELAYTTWCGRRNRRAFWRNPRHWLLANREGTPGIGVCRECLAAMRAVIDRAGASDA